MKSPVSLFTPARLPRGGTSRKFPGVSSKFDQPTGTVYVRVGVKTVVV